MNPFNALSAAVALIALTGAARAANADPAVAAFAKVCADTRADFPAVTAAADANGWKKTDASGDNAMAGVTVTDHFTRVAKAGDTALTLTAWSGTTKAGVHVSACTVHVAKSAFAEVLAGAQAWTGFAPQEATAANATFRFSDAPDGRHALAKSDYDAAAAGPGMEILTVSTEGRGAILDLLKIKK